MATEAGELLFALRATFGHAEPAVLGREGDRQAHELIVGRLESLRPGDSVFSEEGADNSRRLHSSRVWIVDPLDGTREFSEAGRVDWAVHVALWEDDQLMAGAVALPASGSTFWTGSPPPLPTAPVDRAYRMVVSRTRPPVAVGELGRLLGMDLVPMGSAGAKSMAVVRGEAEAYVHAGGHYEWDSAAPVAVARAAGLHASRIDGSPLRYNRPDPLLPDLVVCRPELADRVLSEIAGMAHAFGAH